MTIADPEVAAWLETIADEETRQAIARAYEAASQCQPEEEPADDFKPFVYPH